MISCDWELSKPADCNWVFLLSDIVITLGIYNSYHISVAEKCTIIFTDLLCLKHRGRLLGHVILCDRELSKPADCNSVFLLSDTVITLDIYNSHHKSVSEECTIYRCHQSALFET